MTTCYRRQTGSRFVACAVVLLSALASTRGQSPDSTGSGLVQGYVRDSSGKPVANATVTLTLVTPEHSPTTGPPQITHTDSKGTYRFPSLREGAYTLHAEANGYDAASLGLVNIAPPGATNADLVLKLTEANKLVTAPGATSSRAKQTSQPPEFFDEPLFTVAGVTQATNSGGHGSDTVLRTTEALAKATVSLSKESSGEPNSPATASESSLRDALGRNPQDAALHHQLAGLEEKRGNSLEAVREYQRAVELDPSEINFFDWGAELLIHRALEPATGVLAKGNRLFPQSVRMLVALGVAWYARGSFDQATQSLVKASDLDPSDPAPYQFMGKMQSVEIAPSPAAVLRLARFAELRPNDALANYYYAVSLSKQSATAGDTESALIERAESLLLKAAQLDPKFGPAYLELGVLYSRRADFSRAIPAYQKAIALSTSSDQTIEEAHYRLAQAYTRIGDRTNAQQQLQLHDQLAKKTKEDADREHHAIQEFIVSLQDHNAGTASQQ